MMAEMELKAGFTTSLDPDTLTRQLPNDIKQMREAVEIDEALRTVTVRLAPIPIPVTAAGPARSNAGRWTRTPDPGTG